MSTRQKVITLLVLWLVDWLDCGLLPSPTKAALQEIRDMVKEADNV